MKIKSSFLINNNLITYLKLMIIDDKSPKTVFFKIFFYFWKFPNFKIARYFAPGKDLSSLSRVRRGTDN